jgi:hypothetical protein
MIPIVIRFDGAFFPKVPDRTSSGNPAAPEAAARKNHRLDPTPAAPEQIRDMPTSHVSTSTGPA